MKKWRVPKVSPELIADTARKSGGKLTYHTASVLAARGYTDASAINEEFSVSEDSLSDPFLITDMQAAADTINNAINEMQKICVYGDYDCDGIMSTVMLYSYLLEAGADVMYYIPERSDGFGMNADAVKRLAEQGVELIITVDNGIAALSEAELIYELGMRLIVTDHHRPNEELPRAEAIVDPHRSDCFAPFKNLCGAGVVLKLIAALDGGDYTMALEQFGDLCALATVADIVSLKGENRFIVSYGMNRIEQSDRPAMIALKKVSGLENKTVTTTSLGFGLGPRINASGRFGSPLTAVKLFLSEDEHETAKLAAELDRLNTSRKEAESCIMKQIYEQIDNDPSIIRKRVIFLCGKDWHHGVIGIIASRVVERFGKPCFIASESDGEIRGSARSFGEFSVFEALSACSEVLDKFGGHPGAGGFTISSGMADEFDRLLQKFALDNHPVMPSLTIDIDAVVSPAHLTVEDVRGLSVLEPFGQDNSEPLFLVVNAVVADIYPLKNGEHTKLRLNIGGKFFSALMFGMHTDCLSLAKGETCDLVVSLNINTYNGAESVSLIVRDHRSRTIDAKKIFAAYHAFESFMRGETLPKNYYPSMLPNRDEAIVIYKRITDKGISGDVLSYLIKAPAVNHCKLLIALEAMRESGIVGWNSEGDTYKLIKVDKKVDLMDAPVLRKLRSFI